MIAIAITCLLVATVFVALLVATDSLMRGWHSYTALASELRALRASAVKDVPAKGSAGMRKTGLRSARTPARRSRGMRPALRAAA